MVIRTEKLTNYTKIDNTYLEDKNISLKAKGLLTLMLSLPDVWNFNINGLRLLCRESRLAITNALKELVEKVNMLDKENKLKFINYIFDLWDKNQINSLNEVNPNLFDDGIDIEIFNPSSIDYHLIILMAMK